MADTGEDREIKKRVNAHQKEVVREMKALVQTMNVRTAKNKVRRHTTGRPKTRLRIPRAPRRPRLILLLSLLAASELPTAEVIEIAKRVQITGYELARNLTGHQNLPQVPTFYWATDVTCNRR